MDFNSPDNENFSVGHFGFSGAKLENLGASAYTLVGLVTDRSGSVAPFQQQMEKCLDFAIEACRKSPRRENLLARLITFDNRVQEVYGFQPLDQINNHTNTLSPGGMTSLYDASVNGIEAITNYGKKLSENDCDVNAVVFVITDGLDNASKLGENNVKQALANAVKSESLESILSVLIGVNVTDSMVSNALQEFKTNAGFSQYIELNDASEKTLAKLGGFISQSISSQSQHLGSGGPSAPLQF